MAWWFLFIEGLHPNTVYSLLRNGVFQNYYFVKYPEKYNEYSRKWTKENPEVRREATARYREKHPEYPGKYNAIIFRRKF